MRRWGLLAAALLLAAGPALGSNMGVALRVGLSWTPQRFYVISLPYLDGPAPAEGLCQDLARISHQLPAADEDVPVIAGLLPAAAPATCLEHASAAPWS